MDREPKNPFARALQAVKAERWYRATHNLKFLRGLLAMLDYASIGIRVREGAKKKRRIRKQLTELLKRTFEGLASVYGRAPTADEVIVHLKHYDNGEIIHDITEDTVTWIDWRGRVKTASFGTIRNQLTKIRKSYQRQQRVHG